MTVELVAGKHLLVPGEVGRWFGRTGESYTVPWTRQSLHGLFRCSSTSCACISPSEAGALDFSTSTELLASASPPQNAIVDLFPFFLIISLTVLFPP